MDEAAIFAPKASKGMARREGYSRNVKPVTTRWKRASFDSVPAKERSVTVTDSGELFSCMMEYGVWGDRGAEHSTFDRWF